ncbi:MAG: branched-chain-amino-acid transaminase [Planctomycetota bacterium]
MPRTVWINGKLVPREQATVSVFDHGLLYGDGVFEGMRVYGGKVFRLQEHLVRLDESARAICLQMPMSIEAIAKATDETVAANEITDGYIRLVLTRGAGTLGLDPNRCSDPQLIIIADEITLYPEEYYENGLRIITSSVIRNHPAAWSPRIKSLNYLNNIMAKIEGLQAGCVEALMLNHKGEVAECTGDNIFLVKDGKLFTPPLDAGILGGVTRHVVLELAAEANIATCEQSLTKHDVYVADECFLTGSAAEVIPVVEVDSRKIGPGKPGPVTAKLREAFHATVRA